MSWACYFHVFQRARTALSPYIAPPTLAHLLSGALSGVLTSVVTNPIWVVKVRLQLQSSSRSPVRPYAGFCDGLVTIAREEGVLGLYRGLAPSLWLVSHGALQFTLYETVKAHLQARRCSDTGVVGSSSSDSIGLAQEQGAASIADALVAATASKLVASVSTYPLQVVRTRMQERMRDGARYGNFHRAFMHIARTEGLAGLYRGLSANIMRVTPQAAVTFVTYEQILGACANR